MPVRHGRMLVSPFTFYRGAAKIMAADLKDTPTAGLNVQLCGDAHLSNFGVFASPERRLLFDLNDFDETLARAVRIRRQADGGELHDRGAQQRVQQGRCAGGDVGVGRGLPGADGRVRRDANAGHLVREPLRRGAVAGHRSRLAAEGRAHGKAIDKDGREERQEGGHQSAHPGQPAGPVEARPRSSTAATGSSASRRS